MPTYHCSPNRYNMSTARLTQCLKCGGYYEAPFMDCACAQPRTPPPVLTEERVREIVREVLKEANDAK